MHLKNYISSLRNKPSLKKRWLVVIVTLLMLPQVFISYNIVQRNTNIDLTTRLAGTAIYAAQKNAYTYHWQPGDDIKLYTPLLRNFKEINGNTATPVLLSLHKPLVKADYCTVKNIYWFLQNLFLWLSVFLCAAIFKSLLRQAGFLIIATVFFMHSANWLTHMVAGQVYILFTFIISTSLYLTINKKQNTAVTIIAFTSLIRPVIIIASLPFLFKKSAFKWFIFGCIICIATVALTTQTQQWINYKAAMAMYNNELPGTLTWQAWPRAAFTQYCMSNNWTFSEFNPGNLLTLQFLFLKAGINPGLFTYQLVLLITTVGVLFTLYKTGMVKDAVSVLMAGNLLYIFCEIIMPVVRNYYNYIEYLPIIALLFFYAPRKIIAPVCVALFIFNFPGLPKFVTRCSEAIILLLIIISLVIRCRQLKLKA